MTKPATLMALTKDSGLSESEATFTEVSRQKLELTNGRDYYRLDQDEVLSAPIEIARTLPEDILRLAGYYKAVSGVGYVEDHQNPVEFMQKEENGIGKFGPASGKLMV
ncbi:hypothetical protein FVEG_16899 [Fusarium verticillioides 7600]|uniref:Uncharacterized protein n=1 Tax=Gibberella moniliformis (strain M3125 / FGSC 7600) TaxID=334819 RepID=W7MW24_GIBM7|nr:hypothetical protein FVEG_16899 [Fusarium verticillioides 7600]EWG52004.1 hypothetical protein FVEG_16899 [Fusarium verticillioides 7600]RBR07985.1 hypothetical protein FVER53590_28854 [Fusarium verticillioides]